MTKTQTPSQDQTPIQTDAQAPETQAPARVFYPSDYARLQGAVRQARQESGDAIADQLAATIADVLATDSAAFDPATFTQGTYVVPSYVRQLARVLRTARTGRGYEVKGETSQAAITHLATQAGTVLASLPGFSGGRFAEGTQLPGYDQPDLTGDETETDEADETV